MIKLVYCIRRRADIEPEEFRRYWREEHASLVTEVAGVIGAVRYVQSHTVHPDLNAALAASRGAGEPYDGIAEVWFESRETLARGFGTAEGAEAARRLQEDEARFIDCSRSSLFLTEEYPIFDRT